LGLGTKKAC